MSSPSEQQQSVDEAKIENGVSMTDEARIELTQNQVYGVSDEAKIELTQNQVYGMSQRDANTVAEVQPAQDEALDYEIVS